MRIFSAPRIPNVLQIGLIVAPALVSVVVGTAYLIYDSPFSPLIVAGLALGISFVLVCIRWPIIALYSAVLVVLLPLGLFPESIQSYLNRSLTVVALIFWGVYIIIRRRRVVWTSTGLFMFGFLVWCLLTMLWATNLEAAKNELGGYTLRFVLFLFLIANEIKTRENLDGLMYTLAIAGWVFIVAGVFSLFSHGYEAGTRFQILEENENTLGGLFPVLVTGILWFAIRIPNPRRILSNFLCLAFILLSIVLIGLSGSRGGIISWFISMLVLLFWRQTRPWGMLGLFLFIAAIIIAPIILSTTIARFTGGTGETFLGGREALWQAAWLLIRDHPLTGVGVGNGSYAMMTYIRIFKNAWGYEKTAVHNPILSVWVETGLIGLFLYLCVLASSVWSFVREYYRSIKLGAQWLMPYFALVASAYFGYFASWIKGGGMESSFSFFLMIALLLIPTHMRILDSNS